MNAILLFMLFVLAITVISMFYGTGGLEGVKKLLTDESTLGIRAGIYKFVGFGLAVATILLVIAYSQQSKAEWFKFTQLELGLDATNGQSPQCEDGPNSDKLTSNGGLTQNIFFHKENNYQVEFNVPWTHHSCAFNDDRNGYDGIGVEARLTWYWK